MVSPAPVSGVQVFAVSARASVLFPEKSTVSGKGILKSNHLLGMFTLWPWWNQRFFDLTPLSSLVFSKDNSANRHKDLSDFPARNILATFL